MTYRCGQCGKPFASKADAELCHPVGGGGSTPSPVGQDALREVLASFERSARICDELGLHDDNVRAQAWRGAADLLRAALTSRAGESDDLRAEVDAAHDAMRLAGRALGLDLSSISWLDIVTAIEKRAAQGAGPTSGAPE